MDVPTRSSKQAPNARARLSLLLGVVAVAALPVGVTLARETRRLELLDASGAIPVAAVAGILAIALSHSGRRRVERTIGRAGGSGSARVGRALGVLGLLTAVAAAIAVGVYEILVYLGE